MRPKTYGQRTLASFFFLSLWMYIIVGDEMKIFLPAVMIIVLLSILFVPLIRIDNEGIRLYSISPFVRNRNIEYRQLEKIHIHAGNIQFRIEYYLKDGTRKSTTNFFRYYDMEEVFEHLCESGVEVSSSGIRTITWKK